MNLAFNVESRTRRSLTAVHWESLMEAFQRCITAVQSKFVLSLFAIFLQACWPQLVVIVPPHPQKELTDEADQSQEKEPPYLYRHR